MEIIELDGVELQGYCIKNVSATIMLIKAPKGALGCGYFDIDTADKFDDVMIIVKGVSSFEDMLNAPVANYSTAAEALGVTPAMTGRDALRKLL